jgi:integrase/recombinase XerC
MLEKWREHLALERRRSPHTVRAYAAAAARLLESCELDEFASVARLDPKDLRRHLGERRASGLGNASAARELSAVKAFVAFACVQEGGAGADSLARVRGPRLKKGVPRPVTPDDALALADAMEAERAETWVGLRDRAVLLLLYGAGLRIAEALSLKGEHQSLGETVTVLGKGGKQRVVPILPIVRKAVAAYVAACPYPLALGEPLFRGAKGGPLDQGIVQKVVARTRYALGLPASATPHALRHSFASHLLSEGVDLRSLQELLGHASLGSTQIYTRVDAARMLSTYRAAHPREANG